MKRVRSISDGTTTIEWCVNALYYDDDKWHNPAYTETDITNGGTIVVWVTDKVDSYATISSKNNGWVSKDDINKIIDMRNSQADITVTFVDGSTQVGKMAIERPFDYTPVHEGADEYKCTFEVRV